MLHLWGWGWIHPPHLAQLSGSTKYMEEVRWSSIWGYVLYSGSLHQWLMRNLEYGDATNEPIWPTYFFLAIWWIWKWRNCFVFERRGEIPVDTWAFLQIWFDETRRSLTGGSESTIHNIGTKEEIYVCWKPPPSGWYTLNSDEAAKGAPGPTGGGVIIRDAQGSMVSALVANFCNWCAFRAEVMALLQGLELTNKQSDSPTWQLSVCTGHQKFWIRKRWVRSSY